MKMDIQADKKYNRLIFYILNKIKDRLLFHPGNNRVVDYMLDLNIKRQMPGLMEERTILQKLKNDGIISDAGEMILVESGEKGTPEYRVYEIYPYRVSENFNDYYDHYQRIQSVVENYCWFDNNTFYLTLYDDSTKAISFDTQKGTRGMIALFQALIEHWKKNGSKPILGNAIVKAMAKFGSKTDTTQLKNIISNIRNKKIKPAGLEEKISIEFDKKTGGWSLNIKR